MSDFFFLNTRLLFLCLLTVGVIVWLVRCGRTVAAANDVVLLSAVKQLVERWVAQGQLTPAEAAPMLRVLAAMTSASVAPAPVVASITMQSATAPPVVPAIPVVATPIAPAARVEAAPAAPVTPPPSWGERVWAGLLALRTRQTLLFLGAFLLLMSSLVLVIFNWESFPAVLQFALLALVSAALWFGGDLLERRWAMASAGSGLRAVGGIIAPVAAFAFARMLNLGLHGAWLLVSLVSVPLYCAAAWRTHQRLFAVAASLAGASALTAACSFVAWSALPPALCLIFAAYLPLTRRLHTRFPELENGPVLVAHLGTPLALLGAGTALFGGLSAGWLGTALAAGALFYATAAWIDRREVWSWAAAALGPFALLAALVALRPDAYVVWSGVMLGLYAVYLLIARVLRLRVASLAHAPNLIAHVLAPLALVAGGLLGWGRFDGAAVLWIGCGFYLLAVVLEPLPRWSLALALAVPLALCANVLTAYPTIGGWLALVPLVVASAYLVIAHGMRQAPGAKLVQPPRLVAHGLVPLALLAVLALLPFDARPGTEALVLWGGVAFYMLALALDRLPHWLWTGLLLTPLALVYTCAVLALQPAELIIAALGALALGYVYLGVAIEPRARRFALPFYGAGLVLGLVAGAIVALAAALRATGAVLEQQLVLPWLIAACLVVLVASHRGRLSWLSTATREQAACAALALAGLLCPIWLWALLDVARLAFAWRGLALLPGAALLFVAAWSKLGALRTGYAPTLRVLASVLGCVLAACTFGDRDAAVWGAALLTATWVLQLVLQRRQHWAALALATALLAVGLALGRFAAGETAWLVAFGALAFSYTLGGTLARRTGWRCLTWPGTALGTLLATIMLAGVAFTIGARGTAHGAELALVFTLAGLAALHAALWQRAALGYVAAPLLIAGALLAAGRGFFLRVPFSQAEYAIILCALTACLAALGQAIRLRAPRFAYPYEQAGFVLLIGAPLLAGFAPRTATLVWGAVSLLCMFATWRYRLAWAITSALLAADAALIFGTGWLAPSGEPSGAGLLLAVAACAYGLLACSVRRWKPALRVPIYVATGITAWSALAFAATASLWGVPVAQTALLLTGLLALLALLERREGPAWAALGLLALGLASLHATRGITLEWSAAYGTLEALALGLVGWLADVFARRGGRFAAALAVWRRPLLGGPLVASAALVAALVATGSFTSALQPLIFALVMLALLLTTLAVWQRKLEFAYGAGAALVAALCCQFVGWNVREPQWYVLPAGLYLLALAAGLRRFQGQRSLSQVIECGALGLILGVAGVQALQATDTRGLLLTCVLCAEALLLLSYGVVAQLRVPFLGGTAGFVAGVLWLGIYPLTVLNAAIGNTVWLLLGMFGLTLVGVYVLLERRQEQLVRAGRALVERISAWA